MRLAISPWVMAAVSAAWHRLGIGDERLREVGWYAAAGIAIECVPRAISDVPGAPHPLSDGTMLCVL
jgi:hypothetical protein